MTAITDSTGIKGCFRLQLEEDGEIVGDSGWHENAITNPGFRLYLTEVFASSSNSLRISHIALGTGTQPGAAATTLDGEITENANMRGAVTRASNGSTRVDYTATFASDVRTNTYPISNIGLFQQSNTNTGTIFAGNTYTSSQWAANQAVNVTYSITFA